MQRKKAQVFKIIPLPVVIPPSDEKNSSAHENKVFILASRLNYPSSFENEVTKMQTSCGPSYHILSTSAPAQASFIFAKLSFCCFFP